MSRNRDWCKVGVKYSSIVQWLTSRNRGWCWIFENQGYETSATVRDVSHGYFGYLMANVRDLWPLYPWLVTGVFFHIYTQFFRRVLIALPTTSYYFFYCVDTHINQVTDVSFARKHLRRGGLREKRKRKSLEKEVNTDVRGVQRAGFQQRYCTYF